MNILTIDTTSNNASVALKVGERIIENEQLNIRDHSVKIMPMIQEILKEGKIGINDVDVFGVITGPGSFTGIRIGIATIKGLAFDDENVGVYDMTSLEELAYNARSKVLENDYIFSIIDAKNDQVYFGLYVFKDSKIQKIKEDANDIYNISEILEKIEVGSKIYIVGNGYEKHNEYLKKLFKNHEIEKIEDENQHAKNIIVKILEENNNNNESGNENNNGNIKKFKKAEDILPNYIKKAQAQRMLDEKNNKKKY